jgi:error-prone DNA polymerase
VQLRLRALRYEYPEELVPRGLTASEHLKALTEVGIRRRWPGGAPVEVREQIDKELVLIRELRFEHYFLTVEDIVRYARMRGILCQGRGSAANSAVCYVLGVTEVDPARMNLLLERFISKERHEPPDIDIDFEHQRREEVMQYVYNKYGRHRAALAASVITYRRRMAIRDVARALGLPLDLVDALAKSVQWFDTGKEVPAQLRKLGFDPTSRITRLLMTLVAEIVGFPRHLSQHVGGFVMSHRPLSTLVPVENAAMPDRTRNSGAGSVIAGAAMCDSCGMRGDLVTMWFAAAQGAEVAAAIGLARPRKVGATSCFGRNVPTRDGAARRQT